MSGARAATGGSANTNSLLRNVFYRLVGARGEQPQKSGTSGSSTNGGGPNFGKFYDNDDRHANSSNYESKTGSPVSGMADDDEYGRCGSGTGDRMLSSSSSSSSSNRTSAVHEIAKHKLVFFGEVHSTPSIVAFQRAVQDEMTKLNLKHPRPPPPPPPINAYKADDDDVAATTTSVPTLHVVMEHFSFEMQQLLDDYQANKITFEELVDAYQRIGTEGHNLEPYRALLEDAVYTDDVPHRDDNDENKDHDEALAPTRRKIRLHAGFIPRTYARQLMKESDPQIALNAAAQWLPIGMNLSLLEGTANHFQLFQSLLRGSTKLLPLATSAAATTTSASETTSNDTNENNVGVKDADPFMKKIFKAQVLKDVAMANKINQLLDQSLMNTAKESNNANNDDDDDDDDKILVLVGNGHILHYCGVPERVLEQHPEVAADTCVVVSASARRIEIINASSSSSTTVSDARILQDLQDSYSPNAADYFYVYADDDEDDDDMERRGVATTASSTQHNPHQLTETTQTSTAGVDEAAERAKLETKKAYDKVGATAQFTGNMTKAHAIMRAMHYTDEQIDVAGDDAYNFQGVGNPHIHAQIQPGEIVLDVGSGLGIDTFIAHHNAVIKEKETRSNDADDNTTCTLQTNNSRVGKGFVIGIDISDKEVHHAQTCARRRQIEDRSIRFTAADMEQIPLPDNCIDVIISNGAFCLAPNKHKAFSELYRVLKPGGRISVCTTTTQDKDALEPGVEWPICMQMFIQKSAIQPMCEKIGFVDVVVDDYDSSMSLELPEEVLISMEQEEERQNQQQQQNNSSNRRSKVHVGSPEFRHLEQYDMDKICARVCVVAHKPTTATN